jgi:hypothetical protein
VTVPPEVAVADTVNGAAPRVLFERGPNVIVCAVGATAVTVKDEVTAGADAHSVEPTVPPGCEARIVQTPEFTMVTVEPLTVHTPVVSDE